VKVFSKTTESDKKQQKIAVSFWYSLPKFTIQSEIKKLSQLFCEKHPEALFKLHF